MELRGLGPYPSEGADALSSQRKEEDEPGSLPSGSHRGEMVLETTAVTHILESSTRLKSQQICVYSCQL